MRTDIELQRDVADELRWDPSVRDHEIGVVARDGVVTLTGAVDSYAQKLAAERAVERIVGVRAVADDLEVQLPSIHLHTDTAIAHAVVDALAWNIDVPNERIRAKVANGWVTLHGIVEWEYQREAAGQAVSALSGVRGVVNEIVVEPGVPSPENVSLEIRKALRGTQMSTPTRRGDNPRRRSDPERCGAVLGRTGGGGACRRGSAACEARRERDRHPTVSAG